MRITVLYVFFFCMINVLHSQKLEVSVVDNSTYTGKAMFGYQGWFGHPDDESSMRRHWHWGNLNETGMEPLEVEMYPDLREFSANEKYPTAYTFSNGEMAPVFSSRHQQTVMRHMKWVRDYNVDGVFLQRFISERRRSVIMRSRDSTTVSVMKGCEEYGRVFAIMYDGIYNAVDAIKADWMHLVDDIGILSSDRYLNHSERPLVALWGYTHYDKATVEQLKELIDWFHHSAPPQYRASIKLGLNDSWFDLDQEWMDAFAEVEVISPWSVGRFRNQESFDQYVDRQIIPGKKWCDEQGVLFVPVLFPGFSWHNLREGAKQNEIPRNGGEFFWMQAHSAIENEVESMYFAMLDELDEATAFLKTAEDSLQSPAQAYWLNLDVDGFNLPSDWYLRCAGKAAETLRGNTPNNAELGIPAEGMMTIRPDEYECSLHFIFPDFAEAEKIEISLDGGVTFPYVVSDDSGTAEIRGLTQNVYDVFVRHPNLMAVPMGKYQLNCNSVLNDE